MNVDNLNKDLDRIAVKYDPSTPQKDFDYWLLKFDFEILKRYLIGETVIELGCGKGIITLELAKIVKNKLIVVDGSKENINYVKNILKLKLKNNKKVELHHSLWQEFDYNGKVSDVVFFSGLEHLTEEDGIRVLLKIKKWLNYDSRLHIVVPNVKSMHRRIAWYGGIVTDIFEFSERDMLLGHKTLYDKDKLFNLVKKAGYKIYAWEGIFLKPFPNDIMNKLNLNEKELRGLFEIGKELPDYCAHIYVCCMLR